MHYFALLISPERDLTPQEGAADRLHRPTTATTVRVRDGEVLLTDGPYAEGAEVANGF